MARKRIVAIKRTPVRGGVEVQALSRSPRGTKYISGSIVILTEGMTEKEIRKAVADAAVSLLPESTRTG